MQWFNYLFAKQESYTSEYRSSIAFGKRKELSERVRENYPDRIPVVVESKDLFIDRKKFLVPGDLSVANFQTEIRKHIPDISPHQAIFLFLEENVIPNPNTAMCHIYDIYKNEDGLLYVICIEENTFG